MVTLPGKSHRWLPGRDRRAVRHAPPTVTGAEATPRRVVVVGGGIAGLSAATALAEGGWQVTLVEREQQLGGRVRSWPVELEDGDRVPMSRGFHAFFRQYYQLRSLLRRADPLLTALRPVEDYPLTLKDGPRDSFAGVPRTPPWNLAGFVLRSPSFALGDLAKVDLDAALGLLDVRFPQTFVEHQHKSAAQVLDELGFPDQARHLALEVFARSFFADPHEFSGAELVAMFHSYFVGSAEGLLFDVSADDFDTALWRPLAAHLERLGVDLRTGRSVTGLAGGAETGWRVTTDDGELAADAVVLAADVGTVTRLVADAELDAAAAPTTQSWRERVAGLRTAPPFVVWRRWYDRPTAPGAPDFLGTSGYGPLDNVSLVHQFEESARRWAARRHGSVVELHAYAVPEGTDAEALRRELDAEQALLHPELDGARVLGEQWLWRQDCPLAGIGEWHERPGVVAPDPSLVLAGDGIRCEHPVALMERAATTGFQAANHLLTANGRPGLEVWTTPVEPRFGVVPAARKALRATGLAHREART